MKKKDKKPEPLIKASEFAPPERARHDGGLLIEPAQVDFDRGVVQLRQKARITCKLDWYYRQKLITEGMWKAGARFTFLHFVAGKLPRTTPMYGDFVSGRRGQDPLAGKTDAQIRLEDALAVLEGAEADVVWDVCGNDLYAGTATRMKSLLTGLRALEIYFGVT